MSRKRIYVAYFGGTIGMQPTAAGYAPGQGQPRLPDPSDAGAQRA